VLHLGGLRLWPLLVIRHVHAQVSAGGLPARARARARAPCHGRSVITSCLRFETHAGAMRISRYDGPKAW